MARYSTNAFIASKRGSKIAIFLFILFFLIITNFVIVSYYQSQITNLGNSINIAGKNRFLTSNLMLHVSEYLFEDSTKDSSEINSAINQLESNILALRQGGNMVVGAEIDLKPLPRDFLEDWNIIYQKWISLKTNLANKIIESNDEMINSQKSLDSIKEASLLEPEALSLIDSSNLLVTKLSNYLKNNSEYLLFIQQIFTILLIVVTMAFAFYISNKILRPVISLTSAISKVKKETLNGFGQSNRNNNYNNDELSILSSSFNYMLNSIKNTKNQDESIKELKKENEELKHKDQLKDEFINIAAHEIKNPIQPIIAFSELLGQKKGIYTETDKRFLDIIFRNAKRLMQLAEEILDVTRIESGPFSLKKEKFNLKRLITDILKEYEQKIIQNKTNIQLFYQSHENDDIIIEADRNRLSQVIYNLLNNAIKFTNEGSITVIVERKKNNTNDKGDEILVSIKDTGTGIHPEIFPKLFTKFATTSMTSGTGLGLFISKCIIEMHGGRIWAINNNEESKEGIGSTFIFSLPGKQ